MINFYWRAFILISFRLDVSGVQPETFLIQKKFHLFIHRTMRFLKVIFNTRHASAREWLQKMGNTINKYIQPHLNLIFEFCLKLFNQ